MQVPAGNVSPFCFFSQGGRGLPLKQGNWYVVSFLLTFPLSIKMAPWSTSKENRIGLSFPRLRVVKSKLNKSRVPRPLQRRVLSAQASDNRDWATLGDELSPPLPRLLAAGAKASLEREVFDMQMVLYNLTLGLGPSYPSWAGEVGSANPQIKQTSDNLSVIKYQRSSASTAQVRESRSLPSDKLTLCTRLIVLLAPMMTPFHTRPLLQPVPV